MTEKSMDYKTAFEFMYKALTDTMQIDQAGSKLRAQMTDVIVKLMGDVRDLKALCEQHSIAHDHIGGPT